MTNYTKNGWRCRPQRFLLTYLIWKVLVTRGSTRASESTISGLDFEATLACMAQVPGSPDIQGRSIPSWSVPEGGENITEALQALDTYKKKDPSKGNLYFEASSRLIVILILQ